MLGSGAIAGCSVHDFAYEGSLKGYIVSERKNGNKPSDSIHGTVFPRNSICSLCFFLFFVFFLATRFFVGGTKRETTVALSMYKKLWRIARHASSWSTVSSGR